jgi:hypothetical protein
LKYYLQTGIEWVFITGECTCGNCTLKLLDMRKNPATKKRTGIINFHALNLRKKIGASDANNSKGVVPSPKKNINLLTARGEPAFNEAAIAM